MDDASFPAVAGMVGLLDERLEEIGERQQCEFEWSIGPGRWSFRLLSDHEFDLHRPASHVAIYDDDGQRMFQLPIMGRPMDGLYLVVGPNMHPASPG